VEGDQSFHFVARDAVSRIRQDDLDGLEEVFDDFVLVFEDSFADHEEENVDAFVRFDVVEILCVQQVVYDLVSVFW